MEFKTGELARSKAGHDKGKIYVVISGTDKAEGHVFVADGVSKTVESPKKKNPVHLQVIHKVIKGALTDENIRDFLKSYGGDN